MVKTSSFVSLVAVVLAVISSLAAGQDIHKPSSLTGSKSSPIKCTVSKISPYTEASAKKSATATTKYTTAPAVDAADLSDAEDDAYDYSTLADSTDASAPVDLTEEDLVDSSSEEEVVDTSVFTDSTEASASSDLADPSTSSEQETIDASGAEELVDSSTLTDATDSAAKEPAESTAEEELAESSAQADLAEAPSDEELAQPSSEEAAAEELTESLTPVDLTAASGEAEPTEEATDASIEEDYTESSGTEELVDPSALEDSTAASGEEELTESSAGGSSASQDSTAPSPSVRPTSAPVSKASKPVAATPAPASKTPAPAYKPPPVVPSLPNWIGVKQPTDKACYRKTHRTKKCPPGYEFDKIATCWAECPVEYPVECGMECIPQNKDCTLAILDKVNAVATVALNAATSGVFGKLVTASKGVQRGVKCGQQLYAATNKIVGYAKELETKFPNTTKSQIQYLLTKSDFAVYDLPVAVTTCLGLPTPTGLQQVPEVVNVIKKLLEKVTINGQSILEPSSFIEVTSEVGAGDSVSELKPVDLTELNKLLGSGVTCGTELKSTIDRVTIAVQEMKTTAPTSPVDAVRLAVSSSDLFLKDIPAVTSSCVPKDAPNALQLREDIRKTFQVIIDQIIDSSSNGDKPLSKAEYALKIADFGLDAVAMFDPTGIASMAKEFIQPICGPTAFLGEVDDGGLDQALGLRTVGKAFAGSNGAWTKSGDGVLKIIFESTDNKDVRVNIMSGGNKIAEVPVKKGKTVEWTKPLAEMKDKTMYLDRWRPGLLGLPGTGGGSLLLWVPHTSKGGHLELRAQLNVS